MGRQDPDRTAADLSLADARSERGHLAPAEPPRTGRLVGVDWGERRIGVARSDEAQILAQPLATLTRRTGKRVPMRPLLTLLHEHAATGVVVGLPLSLSGRVGPAAEAAISEAAAMGAVVGVPVETFDERLTTVTAHRHLMQQRIKKENADAVLTSWTVNAGRYGHFLYSPRAMPTRLALCWQGATRQSACVSCRRPFASRQSVPGWCSRSCRRGDVALAPSSPAAPA